MSQLIQGDARLPAYARLRDQIAARIGSGEWEPDQALPSENRLAAEYRLSVGTVRKAIEQLASEGLLERRRGSGTFLRKPAFDGTLFRFFQIREHSRGKPSIPESRLILRAIVDGPHEVCEKLGDTRLIRIERVRSLGGSPVLFEEIYIPHSRFDGFEALPEQELGPLLYPLYFERFGVLIATATDEVSFGSASPRWARHLGVAEGAPVAIIERMAFDIERRPVEWRQAYGSAQRFRYQAQIT